MGYDKHLTLDYLVALDHVQDPVLPKDQVVIKRGFTLITRRGVLDFCLTNIYLTYYTMSLILSDFHYFPLNSIARYNLSIINGKKYGSTNCFSQTYSCRCLRTSSNESRVLFFKIVLNLLY